MLGPITYQLVLVLHKDRLRAADRRRTVAGPRNRTARPFKHPSR
jgi:hypothetical protein